MKVIDHFVSEARNAGHSWSEIGDRLGVTKQAVRERFVDRVDVSGRERFMPRLRQCVAKAGELAQQHASTEIETTYLLLALGSNDGVACTVLDRLGAVPDRLAVALQPYLGDGRCPTGRRPESREFAEALRSSTAFAFQRGHDYVGTEHQTPRARRTVLAVWQAVKGDRLGTGHGEEIHADHRVTGPVRGGRLAGRPAYSGRVQRAHR